MAGKVISFEFVVGIGKVGKGFNFDGTRTICGGHDTPLARGPVHFIACVCEQ